MPATRSNVPNHFSLEDQHILENFTYALNREQEDLNAILNAISPLHPKTPWAQHNLEALTSATTQRRIKSVDNAVSSVINYFNDRYHTRLSAAEFTKQFDNPLDITVKSIANWVITQTSGWSLPEAGRLELLDEITRTISQAHLERNSLHFTRQAVNSTHVQHTLTFLTMTGINVIRSIGQALNYYAQPTAPHLLFRELNDLFTGLTEWDASISWGTPYTLNSEQGISLTLYKNGNIKLEFKDHEAAASFQQFFAQNPEARA